VTYGIMSTRVGNVLVEVAWEKHQGYRLVVSDLGASYRGELLGGDVRYYAKLSSALSAAARVVKQLGA
jgi:hypothetical protein